MKHQIGLEFGQQHLWSNKAIKKNIPHSFNVLLAHPLFSGQNAPKFFSITSFREGWGGGMLDTQAIPAPSNPEKNLDIHVSLKIDTLH